jgi:two-component system, OmpR family, phosphate regulon sensor histidine kinase PhoR
LVGKSMLEAFLDHGVEELAAEARSEGHASGEYVLSGEPPKTLSVHVWRVGDGGVSIALTDVSELIRLRRIRTEFVGNLSHELRTPLSTVRLLTESLALEAERTDLPPRVRESINKIDVETGHLVQMVNELLDLAKIEQGDAPMRHDDVDLVRVAEEASARLSTYANRQDVGLRVEVEPGLETTVVGDEDRLGQLMANLIHNAIKFSSAGSEVVIHVRGDRENVLVEVEDHGPGIPQADRNRIFERFYKVDRARSRGRGGTGLGLAIARHIVDRHRGHIWVQSEEGSGSSFFVSLPKADPA